MGEVLGRVDSGGPWWVVALAALPSAISAVWVVWRHWSERGDRRAEAMLTREERQARDMQAQRDALTRDQAAMFDRLRTEIERERARTSELEKDRDRGWDLARYWNRRAHELRHAGLNAQTIVAGLCARDELPAPVWPDMTVAGLEEPK